MANYMKYIKEWVSFCKVTNPHYIRLYVQMFHLEGVIGELLLPPEALSESFVHPEAVQRQTALFGDTITARAFNDNFEYNQLYGMS